MTASDCWRHCRTVSAKSVTVSRTKFAGGTSFHHGVELHTIRVDT